MKSKIFTLTASLFFALLSFGQTSSSNSKTLSFNGGIVGGATLSQIHGDGIGGFNKLGYNLGATVQVLNHTDRGLHLSIIYNQKGSRKPPNPTQGDYVTWAYRFTYIDIPILYAFSLKKFGLKDLHVEYGLQPSVLVAAEENFYGVDFDPTNIPIKDYDLNVVLGVQVEMNNGSRFFTRLTQSIIPIAPKPNNPLTWWDNAMRNMTLEMGFIVLFSLRN